jgi:DNA-binding LacI/PurR family transcriptional regulator
MLEKGKMALAGQFGPASAIFPFSSALFAGASNGKLKSPGITAEIFDFSLKPCYYYNDICSDTCMKIYRKLMCLPGRGEEYLMRSVTVKDIAQLAEVSIATVSRALNNHDNINEDVRQRVLQIAAELGYVKAPHRGSGIATRHARQQLKKISFLLCDTHSDSNKNGLDFFWAHILYGAEVEARKANIKLFYEGIPDQSPYQLQAQIREMQTDGVLLVGPSSAEMVRAIQETAIPLVLIDNSIAGVNLKVDAVLSDNYEGARQIVQYLLSQGHRHIAYIGAFGKGTTRCPIYTFEWRKKGYCVALTDAGIPLDEDLIQECDSLQPEAIAQLCRRLLALQKPISAIFCANDPIAIRVIKALHLCGLKVPDDISVVGFDDVEMAEHIIPSLTTVHVHKEAMGASAVQALIARTADPQAIHTTHTLSVDLVIRGSVRPWSDTKDLQLPVTSVNG